MSRRWYECASGHRTTIRGRCPVCSAVLRLGWPQTSVRGGPADMFGPPDTSRLAEIRLASALIGDVRRWCDTVARVANELRTQQEHQDG